MSIRALMFGMDSSADAITEHVNNLRARARLSLKGFAVAMGYANASSIQRYIDPKLFTGGYLHRDLVAKMEEVLVGKGTPPITLEDVWALAGPEFADKVIASRGSDAPGAAAPLPTFGTKSLPVYAAAMGGDGHVIITFDPIEYIERPSYLERVSGAYGVYIVGDSMYPAYRPSDIAYIHPQLPPSKDTDVVLFHTPPVANAECIIKQLNGWDDRQWHLEQFNPPLKFSVDKADWPVCHRVLGRHNRR